MIISRALIVLLFFLNNTLARDGCEWMSAWRCGDTCINADSGRQAECKCGGEIFNLTAEMWCCNDKPCEGRGEKPWDTWLGEEDKEGRLIGAECSGTALKLDEACKEKCNDHEEDSYRNSNGVVRNYQACGVTNIKTTQCIREGKHMDGKVDCRNRADEEIFQTSIKDTSLLLLDLDQILRPCNTQVHPYTGKRHRGFNCSGSSRVDLLDDKKGSDCLEISNWCHYNSVAHKNCTELAGTTATGKATDPQVCKNQTFWEHKSCIWDQYHRCTGDTPGQCVHAKTGKCLDGSSDIKEAQDGHCDGEEVMCTAEYYTKWDRLRVCITDKYKCDGVRHCLGAEDEANCAKNSTSECYGSDCNKAYKAPIGGHCEKEKEVMCTARDGFFAGRNICVGKKFQCDNYLQCEDGQDEKQCEEEYKRKRTFKKDQHFICRNPYMTISNDIGSGKFYPMRAIRWVSVIIIIITITTSWSGAT